MQPLKYTPEATDLLNWTPISQLQKALTLASSRTLQAWMEGEQEEEEEENEEEDEDDDKVKVEEAMHEPLFLMI